MLLPRQQSPAIPLQTVGSVDIWDVSAVSCSFFVKDCCCQEKSSCASLHFLRIVPSYHISLGCSGTARPEESKLPHQTIDSCTLSPQTGKDYSKLSQTRLLHELKQLAARFLSFFPFLFLRNFFHTSHSVGYSSFCAYCLATVTPQSYMLFVWLLVQRQSYLQDLM